MSVKQFLASLSEGTQNIVGNCDSSVGNGYLLGDAMWPNLNQWSRLRKFSIDQFFAREQKAYRVRVVDLDGRVGEQVDQNTIAGPHYIQNSTNCDINGNAPLIIIDGCENISVTATSDAVLVRGPTASEDQTSLIAELEKNALRQLYEAPVRHHNWGDEIELERRPGFVMRKLIIHPGKSILPHLHNHRWESWQIISGVGRITIDTDSQLMKAGDYVPIPATIVHGLINIENEPLRILECRRGSYLTKVDHINVGEAPPLSPDLVSAHSDGTSASSPP